ncbi:hypothetical protein D0Y50_00345 [Salinimonas sediminis]|uniref:Uncharacterized protein n=1 Tax=Salinimonas sediminis TaxID=2303538 RepID=A0A346NHE4_9ALTE|nr:hypothetical protein D0Y50_00345 [Salinimonas sediminis]
MFIPYQSGYNAHNAASSSKLIVQVNHTAGRKIAQPACLNNSTGGQHFLQLSSITMHVLF